jgi:hypothetical protein
MSARRLRRCEGTARLQQRRAGAALARITSDPAPPNPAPQAEIDAYLTETVEADGGGATATTTTTAGGTSGRGDSDYVPTRSEMRAADEAFINDSDDIYEDDEFEDEWVRQYLGDDKMDEMRAEARGKRRGSGGGARGGKKARRASGGGSGAAAAPPGGTSWRLGAGRKFARVENWKGSWRVDLREFYEAGFPFGAVRGGASREAGGRAGQAAAAVVLLWGGRGCPGGCGARAGASPPCAAPRPPPPAPQKEGELKPGAKGIALSPYEVGLGEGRHRFRLCPVWFAGRQPRRCRRRRGALKPNPHPAPTPPARQWSQLAAALPEIGAAAAARNEGFTLQLSEARRVTVGDFR